MRENLLPENLGKGNAGALLLENLGKGNEGALFLENLGEENAGALLLCSPPQSCRPCLINDVEHAAGSCLQLGSA